MNPIRILVVDDEMINREIIEEYFSDQPRFSLRLAEGGEEAWEMLQTADEGFDIILLDRMMPGLDGIGLLERIKADQRFLHIPVIMQTAAGEPDQIREGMVAGAYYYLTKPYRGDTLLAIVQAACMLLGSRDAMHQKFNDCIGSLNFLREAEFNIRTVDEANQLAILISQTYPNPDAAVIGISELLVNAVEHGNLGLTYEEKTRLKMADRWKEEIDRLSALPEHASKRVKLHYQRGDEIIRIEIYDQGHGFPWENFLELSAERACDPNGRGIALAKMMSFTRLFYQGSGNIAIAETDLPK
jgi:CheY-like chemotaxis protein/anti-sigma regulatory factor (Ser/Thr protein kinase)